MIPRRRPIPPLEFEIALRLLWLSNNNFTDRAKIGALPEHFQALTSKGLDPLWIRNDAEHDGLAVFQYVVWLAGEGRGLRSAGFKYEHNRDAVKFYTENVHRLIDICPRRIFQIAKVISDNPDRTARAERLGDMLRPDDQRPRLKLPASWIPVLLWPETPHSRVEPEVRETSPDPADTITPEPETSSNPEVKPETVVPEWVAREETPHDASTDIPVEPVAAERGEPISDIDPSPNFEPDPLDLPLRPGRMTVDETKAIQAEYDLPKWKGRITHAHHTRAAFFRACQGQCPPAMREYNAAWWHGMAGQIPRVMIAKASPLMIDHAA